MTNVGILGTGVVGQTLGSAFLRLGHGVLLGSRDADNPKATAWAADAAGLGGTARHGTFRDAAQFGDVIVNATLGDGTLPAVAAAGTEALAGEILIDASNPLDFSAGFPPSLSVPSTDSLAEQIQRANPTTKVVKTLNTVTAGVMVDPSRVPGEHSVFICGDDAAAKANVVELLGSLGWSAGRIIDLGGLASARATEVYVLLWVRLFAALGTADFNIELCLQH